MKNDLKPRTKQFALEVIKFWESLAKDDTSKTLGRQLLRAGTSVAANYRAACRQIDARFHLKVFNSAGRSR
jgi:four helix bundle protein